jgi:uncharacterized transporter YbjL
VDLNLVTPYALSLVVAWAIYRRVRRNIGRQAVNVRRLQVRIGVFAVIGALALSASVTSVALFGAWIGGAAGGAVLGYFALQHTKFEATPQGRYYTPHTYIGLFVTALFLSRIVFRFVTGYSGGNAFAAYQKSPLTLAIFGVLIAYYLVFTIGVLRRSQKLEPPAAAALPATSDTR